MRSKGVVGQGFGLWGVSDLEGIALNEYFFVFTPPEFWQVAYELEFTEESFEDFLISPFRMNYKIRNKILKVHSHDSIINRLNNVYKSIGTMI